MANFKWVPGSVGDGVEYGSTKKTNALYVAERRQDVQVLINVLLSSAKTFNWPTSAGNNVCITYDLKYVVVTENHFHDYLPVYSVKGDRMPETLYTNDFMDVLAYILRHWW